MNIRRILRQEKVIMMNEIVRKVRLKEEKTEQDQELLRYYYAISFVTEMLIETSKMHFSSDEAIQKIREYLIENLN
jgi:hypothetical protein